MLKSVLVAVVLLGGCTKEQVDENAVRDEPTVKAAMQAYVTCNNEHSRKYATQFGDPMSLGRTAEAACYMTRMQITAAAKKISDLATAEKITAQWKEQMVELNAVEIATIRAR